MEIEATDYFPFPQVTLPTITPRSCDCRGRAFCRSMGITMALRFTGAAPV